MKAYLTITGAIYGLLALMHLWIALQERAKISTAPGEFATMLGLGLVAAALAGWSSWLLLKQKSV